MHNPELLKLNTTPSLPSVSMVLHMQICACLLHRICIRWTYLVDCLSDQASLLSRPTSHVMGVGHWLSSCFILFYLFIFWSDFLVTTYVIICTNRVLSSGGCSYGANKADGWGWQLLDQWGDWSMWSMLWDILWFPSWVGTFGCCVYYLSQVVIHYSLLFVMAMFYN